MFELYFVALLLVLVFLVLAFDWLSPDKILLLACSALIIFGILSPSQTLLGFSSNAVFTIAFLYVPVDSYIAGKTVRFGTHSVDGILKGLSDARYLNTLQVIYSSMGLYPKGILQSDLDVVNVGGQIQTEREQFTSGFFQPNSQDIYLFPLVADALNIDRDSDVRHTFHHEFSSILMRKYQFDMIGFMAHNGTDFEYWFDQAKILYSSHDGYYADSELLKQGLLTYYSQTSPENDFNTYAEIVFSEPKMMSSFCSAYKRIEHKYEHVKAFYLNISADFQPVFDRVSC